jgi:ABC-type transporter Mla MlaB component
MWKISEKGLSDEAIVLHIEGQMMSQGVVEVKKICEQYLASGCELTLDLAEVMFVDRSGVALLQELMRRQVTLVNCSLFLAEQLKEAVRPNSQALKDHES